MFLNYFLYLWKYPRYIAGIFTILCKIITMLHRYRYFTDISRIFLEILRILCGKDIICDIDIDTLKYVNIVENIDIFIYGLNLIVKKAQSQSITEVQTLSHMTS